jgi:hypothetical protein
MLEQKRVEQQRRLPRMQRSTRSYLSSASSAAHLRAGARRVGALHRTVLVISPTRLIVRSRSRSLPTRGTMHLSEHDVNFLNEIEVTPAMIDAGMEEYKGVWLNLRDADDGGASEMLTAAYRVMHGVRPLSPR